MKKYLFLVGDLPPAQSANGICVEKIMRELFVKDEGNVHCVLWSEEEVSKFLPYKLHFIKGRNDKKQNFFKRVFNYFRRIVLFPFVYPVTSFSLAGRFYKEALSVIKENGITDVIAVSYPGESIIALNKIKKMLGSKIKTYVYPLDVTLEGDRSNNKLWSYLTKKGGSRFLNVAAKYNDCLFVLENAQSIFKQTIKEKYHNKFEIVGIPLIENQSIASKNNTNEIRIMYAGNLMYNMYNPIPVLDVLEQKYHNSNKNVVFDLFGVCDAKLEQILHTRYNKIKFVNHGWVTEEELNKNMSEADIFINIAKTFTNTIPSKFFKYMCLKKLIIHYYYNEDDPCLTYLKKYGGAVIVKSTEVEKLLSIDFDEYSKIDLEEDLTDVFPTCVPSYTANIIREK